MGPATIRGDRFNYNEAITSSAKEQLLRNLVRLRYGEAMAFLEVNSVLSQYTLAARADAEWLDTNIDVFSSPVLRGIYEIESDPSKERTFGIGVEYIDRPTITYHPILGDEFAQRLMRPITPETVFYLAEAGWSIDLLLHVCVHRINGIANVRFNDEGTMIGLDPSRFAKVAELARSAQDSGALGARIEHDSEGEVFLHWSDSDVVALADCFRALGVVPDEGRVRLVQSPVQLQPDELALQTRSFHSVLHTLAHEIVVPEAHEEDGRVARVDLAQVREFRPMPLINIQHSKLPPLEAHVATFRGGRWFFIDRDDFRSKRTFALLRYLFALQSEGLELRGPLVTVPAGGD